jgi:short-subunit dehydrogenase
MKNVLITGASSGIGRELALHFVKSGHRVWGIARTEEKLKQVAQDSATDKFFYSVCDVRLPPDVKRLKMQMDARSFYPDTLILNAGATSLTDEINHDTNYEGILNVWNTFKADLQGRNSTIAVSGSLFAIVPAPFNLSYSKSKLDALNFLKKLSTEKENCGIQFTYFVLGPVHTKADERLSVWKSLFIPTAAITARYMANHLGKAGLINIFPFSSKALILLNSVLPKTVMNRLVTFLKR